MEQNLLQNYIRKFLVWYTKSVSATSERDRGQGTVRCMVRGSYQ
jgi:hypothetical protein